MSRSDTHAPLDDAAPDDQAEYPGGTAYANGSDPKLNRIRFNFGSEPFAYAVPPGYSAWSSGAASSSGACVSDLDIPAPVPPVDIYCDGHSLCDGSKFESASTADPQLVIVGVYDSGSVSS